MGDTPPVTGKDVQVAKLWQARCRVHACGWDGELLDTFQAANQERQAHLETHRTLAEASPVLAAAITEHDNAVRRHDEHRKTCPLAALDCCQACASLAGHVIRTREQLTLLESPAETTEMF